MIAHITDTFLELYYLWLSEGMSVCIFILLCSSGNIWSTHTLEYMSTCVCVGDVHVHEIVHVCGRVVEEGVRERGSEGGVYVGD